MRDCSNLIEICHWTSESHLAGVPIDIPVHFLVGLLIFLLLRWSRVNWWNCVLLLGAIAAGKEFYDQIVKDPGLLESYKDFVVTLAPVVPFYFYYRWDRGVEDRKSVVS